MSNDLRVDQPGSTAVETTAAGGAATAWRGAGNERRHYGQVTYLAASKSPPIAGTITAGVLMLLVFFGGFGAWAALAPLSSAVIAHGRMVVESNRRTVQHFEGGVIDELLVKEGQMVRTGDVLVRIAPEMSMFRTTAFDTQLIAARANEAKLLALLNGSTEIDFPADILARRHEPEIAETLRAQEAMFVTSLNNLREEKAVLQQRIEQLRSQMTGFSAQVTSTERQLQLSREELRDLRTLLDDGLARRSNVLALERSIAEIENRRGQSFAAIAQAEEAIGGAQIEMSLKETRFREEASRQLQETRGRIVDLRANLGGSEAVLRRTEIRAPIDGRVVDLKVFTVGGVVGSGEAIMDIVPVEDPLVVETRINPTDIDIVYDGLEAEVRLTAFKFRTTPTVPGILTNISADLITEQNTGLQYYKATIILDAESVAEFDLYPGMPVDVMIKMRDRTFVDYILAPLTESFTLAFRDS